VGGRQGVTGTFKTQIWEKMNGPRTKEVTSLLQTSLSMLVRMSRATERRVVQDRLAARQDPLRRVRVDALHQQRDPLQ